MQSIFLLFEMTREVPAKGQAQRKDLTAPLCRAKQDGGQEKEESGEKAQGARQKECRGWRFILAPSHCTLSFIFGIASCLEVAGARRKTIPSAGLNTYIFGLNSDDGTYAPHLEQIHTFTQLLPSGGRQHLLSRCSLWRSQDLAGVSEQCTA